MAASFSATSPSTVTPAGPAHVPATSILNRFIPISATDVYRGLISDAAKLGFRTDSLAAVLESIQDAVARETRSLERTMADVYAPFNPDRDTMPLCQLPNEDAEGSFQDLERRLTYLFEKANFERLDDVTIEAAIKEAKTHGLRIRIRAERVDKLLIWIRGRGVIYKRLPHWKSPWRGRNVKFQVFQRLGVLAKLKDDPHVNIKLFRDVPVADIEALLPHAEVGMNWFDRVKVIGGGAGALSTLAVKLIQGAITLALVSKLMWLIAMAVGLMAGRTIMGYRRNKSQRDAQRTRHLYYQTLANNGGAISWLIDMIGQEEEKEAMLAYALGRTPEEGAGGAEASTGGGDEHANHAASRNGVCATSVPAAAPAGEGGSVGAVAGLKGRAEEYLFERYGVRVDFDEADAIETVDRFELWHTRDEHRTLSPAAALAALRRYVDSARPAMYHEEMASRHPI